MSGLDDKVVVVTGAARGTGRVHCQRFADEGADVIALDAAEVADELRETATQVRDRGRRCVAATADVRDAEAMSTAIAAAVGELGRLDVVVANAGVMSWGRAWEIPAEQWQEIIDVNLTGFFNTVQATVPAIIEAG
ncbi:MAG: SDR family NAD(P)-dependent oxidoreductase, partial [Mycobacterium sp.]